MATETQNAIVDILEESRRDLGDATAGLTEPQAVARPEAGRWSILECVEHVTTVEEKFLTRLEQAKRLTAPRADKDREAELTAFVSTRTTRLKAPEAVRPVGRFATLAEALEQFHAVRSRTIAAAAQRGQDLYMVEAEHPRFGALNGVELMMVIAGHARRHAAQIREIRGAAGA
jgi:DinB superfamily